MFRSVVTIAMALGLAGAPACAPPMAVNGVEALGNKPGGNKPGVDPPDTLQSTGSTFDANTWYYISQTTEKYAYYLPHVQSRNVVAIAFDKDDKVASVKATSLKDGYQVAYAGRETPTRGKELNWLEQILGTVGRGGGMLNPDQNDPGQRPGR